jgi:hypothetical protein
MTGINHYSLNTQKFSLSISSLFEKDVRIDAGDRAMQEQLPRG